MEFLPIPKSSHLSLLLSMTIVSLLLLSGPVLAQDCTQTTWSFFTDANDARTVEFPGGGGSDTTSKMELPEGATVVSAAAHLEPFPKNFSEDRPLDIILVNDVSGSMDNNCNCEGFDTNEDGIVCGCSMRYGCVSSDDGDGDPNNNIHQYVKIPIRSPFLYSRIGS